MDLRLTTLIVYRGSHNFNRGGHYGNYAEESINEESIDEESCN